MPGVNFLNVEYFFGLIYRLFSSGFGSINLATIFDLPLWYRVLAVVFSLIFLIGMGFFSSKLLDLRREEREAIFKQEAVFETELAPKNSRWEKVLKEIDSEYPANWNQALIEADKMLEEVVGTLKLPGENLGEKLKQIERSDFLTLDDAWEAHKVRNRIAHEAGYELGQHEARRVIILYERVFREFDFI